MLDISLVAVLLGEAGGACSCDLHCNIVCNFGIVAVADLEQNAPLAAEMNIGVNKAFVTSEAADGDLLTDLGDCCVDSCVNGHALILGIGLSHHFLNGCRVLLCNVHCKGMYELLESIGLGDEVGLTVDLDDNANAALLADEAVYETFGSDAGSLLCGSGKALLTKIVHRLFHIAIALLERFFAVHHACAGALTKGHYVFCGEFHYFILQIQGSVID